jgi:hypothetical protein
VAGVALARHGNESAYACVRVGRMAFDARHDSMGTSQGIGLCMASHVELRGSETRPGMAIRAAGIGTPNAIRRVWEPYRPSNCPLCGSSWQPSHVFGCLW